MIHDIIVSVDVESNGNTPGINSLWSIGAAAYVIRKQRHNYVAKKIDQFEINLKELPNTVADPKSLAFWELHPEAKKITRANQQEPVVAMQRFGLWLNHLPGEYFVTAWPGIFDIPYLTYYFYLLLGESPFGLSALELRSYAFAVLRKNKWHGANLKSLPKGWLPENPHPHVAVYDAIAQGELACKIIIENFK